jgi:hypothetical protein
MYKIIMSLMVVWILNSCERESNTQQSTLNTSAIKLEERVKVHEIWRDEIPELYSDLLELYQLDRNDYNISPPMTFLKIPSHIAVGVALKIEVYGIWHDEASRSLDGCGDEYDGYSVIDDEERVVVVELKKIDKDLMCEGIEYYMLPTLRDIIVVDTLLRGKYTIVVQNPSGEELNTTVVVE